jgi:hypothetical protein
MSGTAVCCEKEEISFYCITGKLFYGKQVSLTPAYFTNEANKDILAFSRHIKFHVSLFYEQKVVLCAFEAACGLSKL